MENEAQKTLKKYLPSLKAKSRRVQYKQIPPAFQSLYDFEELSIFERPFLLISVKDSDLGPKDFKKHSRLFRQSIDCPQVWFLKDLHPHKVRRMIENELNFIVEDKQVHLPEVNISLRAEVERVRTSTKLSGLSINLIIRQILKADLNERSKVDLANEFNVSKMTIGRALEPLLALNLCEERRSGVAKLIQFKGRDELWRYLKKSVDSPVREEVYLMIAPSGAPYSGISALSRRSMLADDPLPTFAIEKREFNERSRNLELVLEDEAQVRVEIWDRSMILQENTNINVIDTYLILKDSVDERVQIELESLLKKYKLEWSGRD